MPSEGSGPVSATAVKKRRRCESAVQSYGVGAMSSRRSGGARLLRNRLAAGDCSGGRQKRSHAGGRRATGRERTSSNGTAQWEERTEQSEQRCSAAANVVYWRAGEGRRSTQGCGGREACDAAALEQPQGRSKLARKLVRACPRRAIPGAAGLIGGQRVPLRSHRWRESAYCSDGGLRTGRENRIARRRLPSCDASHAGPFARRELLPSHTGASAANAASTGESHETEEYERPSRRVPALRLLCEHHSRLLPPTGETPRQRPPAPFFTSLERRARRATASGQPPVPPLP